MPVNEPFYLLCRTNVNRNDIVVEDGVRMVGEEMLESWMVHNEGHPNIVIKKTSRWLSTCSNGFHFSCDDLGYFGLVHCRTKLFTVC